MTWKSVATNPGQHRSDVIVGGVHSLHTRSVSAPRVFSSSTALHRVLWMSS